MRGSVLLSVLFVLVLLGTFLTATTIQVTSLYRGAQEKELSEKLKGRLLRELFLTHPGKEPKLRETAVSGRIKQHMKVHYTLPNGGHPLYQLSPLGRLPDSCLPDSINHLAPPPSSLQNQEKSFISIKTCSMKMVPLDTSFVTSANFDAQRVRQLEDYSVITSNGFIVISDKLLLKGDITIIAGGEVYINEIIGMPRSHLTAISLSGRVKIERTSKIDTVYIDGRLGADIPDNLQRLESSPYIERSGGWIHGYEKG